MFSTSTLQGAFALLSSVNIQQAVEFLKITGEGFSLIAWYTATLAKTLAWPAVVFGLVLILRNQIQGLIEGIRELGLEFKGAKRSVRIQKYLDEFAKQVPHDRHNPWALV
jgi:hypothetical protein